MLTGGVPDLEPEESTQKSFGVVVSPVDWMNVSVDWWEIERENTILYPLAEAIGPDQIRLTA